MLDEQKVLSQRKSRNVVIRLFFLFFFCFFIQQQQKKTFCDDTSPPFQPIQNKKRQSLVHFRSKYRHEIDGCAHSIRSLHLFTFSPSLQHPRTCPL